MAAILLSACTVTVEGALAGLNVVKIVTPATADDGDTIDVSSIMKDGWLLGTCDGATDNNLLLATDPDSTTVTIPGSTDNEARTIVLIGR